MKTDRPPLKRQNILTLCLAIQKRRGNPYHSFLLKLTKWESALGSLRLAEESAQLWKGLCLYMCQHSVGGEKVST